MLPASIPDAGGDARATMWDGRPRPSDCRKRLGNWPNPRGIACNTRIRGKDNLVSIGEKPRELRATPLQTRPGARLFRYQIPLLSQKRDQNYATVEDNQSALRECQSCALK